MIRIETMAEFDAEGRFIVTGTTTEPVSPGPHSVVLIVDEPPVPKSTTDQNGGDSESPLKWVNGLLVFTGELLEDPEDVRRRLDEERMRQLLGDLAE